MSRVAVLGLGIMGSGIARNLVAAGHAVTVWNRTRAKAEAMAGARVAETPREAAADAGHAESDLTAVAELYMNRGV